MSTNVIGNKQLIFLLIGYALIGLPGCASKSISEKIQDSAWHLTEPPYKNFQQVPGDQIHPAAYYTCDKNQNPCSSYSRVGKNIFYSDSVKVKSSVSIHKERNKNV